MITKELALTICEMFQKDYLNRPIWQTMIDIENLIDKHRPQQLIIPDVVQAKPEKVCKGSWQIGNNCKTCKRCLDTKPT